MLDRFKILSSKASDVVTKIVGTWTFVILYTLSMAMWIGLHLIGTLNIDGHDFIKWNLFLSYFAGIQASIVLMSSTRQAMLDRQKQDEQLDELAEKIEKNNKQADLVSELIEDYLDDIKEKKGER